MQRIYSRVWGTEEVINPTDICKEEKRLLRASPDYSFQQQLATSFDGFCLHRPFEYNKAWHTKSAWYHLDQNGHNKPHKICVQGFVNYYDSDAVCCKLNLPCNSSCSLTSAYFLLQEDGGLVVVPRSHEIFNEIFKNRPELAPLPDFIRLPEHAPVCYDNCLLGFVPLFLIDCALAAFLLTFFLFTLYSRIVYGIMKSKQLVWCQTKSVPRQETWYYGIAELSTLTVLPLRYHSPQHVFLQKIIKHSR